MAGELIKSLVALTICIFVMFVVYFGMGMMVDTFLAATSMLPMTGIGLDLIPTNMRIFNWFYGLGALLALVAFVWVVKVLFFKNKYDDETDMPSGKFR